MTEIGVLIEKENWAGYEEEEKRKTIYAFDNRIFSLGKL